MLKDWLRRPWRNSWQRLRFWRSPAQPVAPVAVPSAPALGSGQTPIKTFQLDIAPNDPLLAYLTRAQGVVEIDLLELNSPALRLMKDAGVKLAVPMVSQGELIGLLNLGPRRNDQEYSSDDHRLLANLATQAAPALRVTQLAHQQQVEARERERMEQEMQVARVIQETLLPETTPNLPGWKLAALWQPARTVSGDFYDFLEFPDGRLGIIVADVTDKGVPAALVMATARSLLRAAAERLVLPGQTLQRANNQLCPDIPPKMFVTCLYMLLDPQTGEIVFANAGHNLPIRFDRAAVSDLRATGMPLGLLPGMSYEETRARLEPGEALLLYSDGLVEAHDPQGQMYGFPRLHRQIAEHAASLPGAPDGGDWITFLMADLAEFTGLDWEQEDDVTLVVLGRAPAGAPLHPVPLEIARRGPEWRTLAEFSLPSQPGNERQAMEQVAQAAAPLGLPAVVIERLKTAVAETTMNAMEHGNHYDPALPVEIRVLASPAQLSALITDHGGEQLIPDYVAPDLEAKLAGRQSPRGWGLFLIQNMVDEANIYTDQDHHTVELVVNLAPKQEETSDV